MPPAISKVEAAKLLLDGWKFRQAHCWTSLQRYYVAAVLVSAIPFVLNDEQRGLLQDWLGAFPIMGLLLGVAAVWQFGAEYIRCNPLNRAFLDLLESDGYKVRVGPEISGWQRVVFLEVPIGWVTVIVLMTVTLALSALSFYVVTKA
jgi:hypothetical protein